MAQSVTTHQANHARILALRYHVSSLNSSITSTLITLADTRTEILSQKITPMKTTARQVPYKVLLDYASQISQYTAPKIQRYAKKTETSTDETTAPANGADPSTQQDTQATQDAAKEGEQLVTQVQTEAPFQPWPTEAIIKQGALGRIQAMSETGQDPATVDFLETGGTTKREDVNVEKMGEAEITAPEEPSRAQEAERKPAPTEGKRSVFGRLDLFNPDDMDTMDDE